ncbi:MAG: hypothetical protein FWG98_08300 [Candidatus Cloacimonetes bacterium]|nr:hypothetical protein [Candidatus Cloacimonadota bacterium]
MINNLLTALTGVLVAVFLGNFLFLITKVAKLKKKQLKYSKTSTFNESTQEISFFDNSIPRLDDFLSSYENDNYFHFASRTQHDTKTLLCAKIKDPKHSEYKKVLNTIKDY